MLFFVYLILILLFTFLLFKVGTLFLFNLLRACHSIFKEDSLSSCSAIKKCVLSFIGCIFIYKVITFLTPLLMTFIYSFLFQFATFS